MQMAVTEVIDGLNWYPTLQYIEICSLMQPLIELAVLAFLVSITNCKYEIGQKSRWPSASFNLINFLTLYRTNCPSQGIRIKQGEALGTSKLENMSEHALETVIWLLQNLFIILLFYYWEVKDRNRIFSRIVCEWI